MKTFGNRALAAVGSTEFYNKEAREAQEQFDLWAPLTMVAAGLNNDFKVGGPK